MRQRLLFFNIIFIFLLGLSLQSCKKDPNTEDEDNRPPAEGTRAQLTLDSLFLYAKEIYLWNDQLPTYKEFQPRQYTSPSRELFAITQIPKNEQGLPYEYTGGSTPKYSTITDEGGSDGFFAFKKTSEVSLEGEGFDFGIAWANVANQFLVLRAVETNSPAYRAGLRRGDVIQRIDGRAVNLSSNTGIDRINDALFQAELKLEGRRRNGTTFSVTMEQEPYTNNPIYKKAVLNAGSKKVGYLAYARFSNEDNSNAVLTEAFKEFATAGVTDLVVDLRYNGGGYVTTAEHLTNLIAPSSASGKVMFIEHYNDLMRSGKATILKNQFFENSAGEMVSYSRLSFSEQSNTTRFDKKEGPQNIRNVVFIVGHQTASASELVINSLKPYVNVKLVGETTYGKPVGFFPIYIDSYEIYLANFETRNANGEGKYYAGMEPDFAEIDDVSADFGDPEELSLKRALTVLGGSSAAVAKQMSINGRAVSPSVKIQPLGTDREFKGMIQDKFKRKK